MTLIPLTAPYMPTNASARVLDLVHHSVERILVKSGDPAALIRRFGTDPLRHVVDWLVVSDQQDADWIHRTSAEGVPLKLAKCGSLDRLRTEADKAMHRETQRAMARLDPTQPREGEKIEMTLDDGWTIVRLLTPEALDRESARMKHCVGNGAYDKDVIYNRTKIFSLRCPQGKPHVTVEIGKNVQIHAKANSRPQQKYNDALRALFVHEKKEYEYLYYLFNGWGWPQIRMDMIIDIAVSQMPVTAQSCDFRRLMEVC